MESQSKFFELEERTFRFAKEVSILCNDFSRTAANRIYINQVIRSSASIGANYIEANESLSKKDFFMRLKISRKEARETTYWLRLLAELNQGVQDHSKPLLKACGELVRIFSAILQKANAKV